MTMFEVHGQRCWVGSITGSKLTPELDGMALAGSDSELASEVNELASVVNGSSLEYMDLTAPKGSSKESTAGARAGEETRARIGTG